MGIRRKGYSYRLDIFALLSSILARKLTIMFDRKDVDP